MGMFDEYEPVPPLACPVCGGTTTFQGHDGPNLLFVWRQGVPHPVDQRVLDPDSRMDPGRYSEFTLPDTFVIGGWCDDDHMFVVDCTCRSGVWTESEARP